MNRIIDYENLSNKIQEWIITYATENNLQVLVVGVSGFDADLAGCFLLFG
jgi:NH3-dependent NAD+ synthetase